MEHIGNNSQYSSEQVEILPNSPLADKRILFLGSSVTFGACSLEDGIPEYFGRRFGCNFTKEAVSGTTLVDTDETSYVSRLLYNIDPQTEYDLFICQLSTNDATQEKPLGDISDFNQENVEQTSFDKSTITGAIEFIISYVRNTWNCPIMFYTGSRYESAAYQAMVDRLYEVADKWQIGIIDLWRDDSFNGITDEERALFMNDPIHPTKAGYMKWWCPEMEKQVLSYIKND